MAQKADCFATDAGVFREEANGLIRASILCMVEETDHEIGRKRKRRVAL